MSWIQVNVKPIGENHCILSGVCAMWGYTEMTISLPIDEFMDRWKRFSEGEMVQDAFNCLPAEQREFILNGTTPEKWDKMFSEEPEDEDLSGVIAVGSEEISGPINEPLDAIVDEIIPNPEDPRNADKFQDIDDVF